MAVRVMIKRTVPKKVTKEQEEILLALINQLRSMASKQPGYISGETMRNVANPDEYLVISTWQNLKDWKGWFASQQRAKIQGQIDALLGQETKYEVYHYPEKRYIRVDPTDYLVRDK